MKTTIKKTKLKQSLILVTLILSLTISSARSQSAMFMKHKDIEGNTVTLNQIKGDNLTVIDFWATWCKPCVKSIPKLIELSEQYTEDEVKFIGVNEDSPRNIAKVKPFSRSLGISYPVILDPEQALMNEFLISVLPSLIIINNDGEILYKHFGYSFGDEKMIKEEIDKLLSKND